MKKVKVRAMQECAESRKSGRRTKIEGDGRAVQRRERGLKKMRGRNC